MSHIDSRLTLALTVTRGRRAPFTVDPLPDGPPPITQDVEADFQQSIAAAATIDDLKSIAADLKSWDLGAHRQGLMDAWSARRAQLESPGELA